MVGGLAVDSITPYQVRLDGNLAWPEPDAAAPSVIRTLRGNGSLVLAFGSCRFAASSTTEGDRRLGLDALESYADRMLTQSPDEWPDALLMLGDQVYADDLSQQTRRRVAAKHDVAAPPGAEVRNYEEYTWLYAESWMNPRCAGCCPRCRRR